MKSLNWPMVVENPAEILRNEEGTFEVVSPYGHVFQVICHRGSQMNVREITQADASESSPTRFVWRIKRVEQMPAA